MSREQISLFSRLPSDECAQRLANAIDREVPLLQTPGSQPVIGRVSEKSIRLRKRSWYRNSFRPVLVAKLEAHDSGTAISGILAPATFHRVFWRIWFIGVWLIGGLMFLQGLIILVAAPTDHRATDLFAALMFPPLILLAGVLFRRFGVRLARGEYSFLKTFLRATIEANETR
ncbi:MAG TPA: hypothetical protein VMO75_04030 [Chthoniobacterales bacterium]|nr:hypothetical protein [Chthoniobacterales bacterium]